MNLELSDEEAQTMMLMIDLAVKAQGVRVAEMAVAMAKKIEAAARPEPVCDVPEVDQ